MSDQNTLELEIALDRLEEKLGDSSFSYHMKKVEAMFKQIQVKSESAENLQEKFNTLSDQHKSKTTVESTALKEEIQARINEIKLPEITDDNLRELQSRVDSAKNQLEKIQDHLKEKQVGLTRKDQDDCWQNLKDHRQSLRDVRKAMGTMVKTRADELYVKAEESIMNETMLKVARQAFIDIQKEVNTLPLRRQERQAYHEKFDKLWKELQSRYKQHREEKKERQKQWKERQADGLVRLESALERVQDMIARHEAEIKYKEENLDQTHWMDSDRAQYALDREKDGLQDALRRQDELMAKIADAKKRLEE